MQCAGVCVRKFEELHSDRHAGGTAADVLYRKVNEEEDTIDDDVIKSEILCSCCHDYKTWKVMHPSCAKRLIEFASKPFYYRVEADKAVTVTEGGKLDGMENWMSILFNGWDMMIRLGRCLITYLTEL